MPRNELPHGTEIALSFPAPHGQVSCFAIFQFDKLTGTIPISSHVVPIHLLHAAVPYYTNVELE
jgi:hypothetical protein